MDKLLNNAGWAFRLGFLFLCAFVALWGDDRWAKRKVQEELASDVLILKEHATDLDLHMPLSTKYKIFLPREEFKLNLDSQAKLAQGLKEVNSKLDRLILLTLEKSK